MHLSRYFFTLNLLVFLAFSNTATSQWVQMSNGMGNIDVNSVVYSNNYLLACTDLYGIYYSTDYGTQWNPTLLINRTVKALGASGNYVFAATSQYGVYRSTNSGQTWAEIPELTNSLDSYNSITINGSNIFVGTHYYGVYRSTNYGVNWSQTSLTITTRELANFGSNF